ncbi:MAG: Galactose-1-phosphate uridylyltransferase [Candidatus Wolfebacteria bacterium GW2011_GWA2_42_10]|uniref:Galactose-1-phosphate uridylyltransferase n=2 Tax=Candidatus Wolfeibacteriota TaxID=1752735 RepID=A0A0G0XLE2_9BACT|nr:MAG: Galactose-1-phosphate uridylyltransferase [Candidatus Wolfebacteria bacterium GW2011_GWB1_41_12]KKS25272.1 MAG: Galactose-1-phosphate uridylyltransferase [Candidatus Wolfebacteria bacterium GW2011_GWA2_42_10]KKT56712.1 MAG: Galactose-1-phosphate uridylyltransferase [Candidatus Wolfebacteria bacterium GW2011_GWA1_44_24]
MELNSKEKMLSETKSLLEESHLIKNPLSGKYTIHHKGDGKCGIEPCPFCEGNEKLTPSEITARRDNGWPNQPGWRIRVVPDKNPIFRVEKQKRLGMDIYDFISATGANEIIVESSRHDDTWPNMPAEKIKEILGVFGERISDLKKDGNIRQVLVYKNYGSGTRVKITHPHAVVVGSPVISSAMKEKLWHLKKHFNSKNRCLLCDILGVEEKNGERIIMESRSHILLAPPWSRVPYEMLVLPKRHEPFFEESFFDLEFAAMLKTAIMKLNAVVTGEEDGVSYTMVVYTAPNQNACWSKWQTLREDFHWHIEIIPRIRLYSSFEIATGFHINNVLPEEAAEVLRKA